MLYSRPSAIYFIKRLVRVKWFERVPVSFASWMNRSAVWLIKSKRTNHLIVFRKGSTIWKSSTLGSEVDLKKQRRVSYYLKPLSQKMWSGYMNKDWTQLQIHLKGDLKSFELGTDSVYKSNGYGDRKMKYSLFGFKWWYNRVMRKLRRRIRYPLKKHMGVYFHRSLLMLNVKPSLVLESRRNPKIVNSLLRKKWLEERMRTPKDRREFFMKLQRKWMLKYRDKKKKTWYFYHTEMQYALRSGVIFHSFSDYTSHPFGGKRYRKRNIIR